MELSVLICCLVSAASDCSQMRQFTRLWSPIWSLWWQTSESVFFLGLREQNGTVAWQRESIQFASLLWSEKAVMFNRVIPRWTVPLLNDNWFKQQHSEPRIVKVRFKSAEVFQRFRLTLLNYVTAKNPNGFIFTCAISQTASHKPRKDGDVTIQLASLWKLKVTKTQIQKNK